MPDPNFAQSRPTGLVTPGPTRSPKPPKPASSAWLIWVAVLVVLLLGVPGLGHYLNRDSAKFGASDYAQTIYYLVAGIGVILAGIWSYFRYVDSRETQTRLEIGLDIQQKPLFLHQSLVFFDAVFKNIGTCVLEARYYSDSVDAYSEPASNHHNGERFLYSVNLRIRRIPAELLEKGRDIDWYELKSIPLSTPGEEEINLLTHYEVDNSPEFWMEPGETYHLGATVMLGPGEYLAKLTFLGPRVEDPEDFWTRLFHFSVPAESKGPASAEVPAEAPEATPTR